MLRQKCQIAAAMDSPTPRPNALLRAALFMAVTFCSQGTWADPVRVYKTSDVDYSWTDKAFYSTDPSRLENEVHLELDPRSPHALNAKVVSFLDGINDVHAQRAIKDRYHLSNQTYLALGRMAFGIMYAESKFGGNWKYRIKERFPWTVTVVKDFQAAPKTKSKTFEQAVEDIAAGLTLEFQAAVYDEYDSKYLSSLIFDLTPNSRGPTQIKFLPEGFEKLFPYIGKDNLHIPKFSGIATMTYLANALNTLEQKAASGGCQIPKDQFLFHLVYIYVGRTNEITKCTATLDDNIYWRRALEVQSQLAATVRVSRSEVGAQSEVLAALDRDIYDLRQEEGTREFLVKRTEAALREAQRERDRLVTFKQEDVQAISEYLLAAGFTVGSHKLLKKVLPSREKWMQKKKCSKLLMGRKRYYALLHSLNSALFGKLALDPRFGLDGRMEFTVDRQIVTDLEAAVELEKVLLNRVRLELALKLSEREQLLVPASLD